MKRQTETMLALGLLTGLGGVAGCDFDENLVIANLEGTVVVSRDAATRALAVLDENGEPIDTDGDGEPDTQLVTDVALIGPVYLGLYASVKDAGELEVYPHPEVGPQYIADRVGDTYPYGGTTVGDLRYACFEALQCKLVSGRFQDFDAILSWFNGMVDSPVTDESDNTIESGEMFRQTCYALLDVATDFEVNITATVDRNEDGSIDSSDLDFVENADGDFEATFEIIQQDFIEGFSIWGFMDAPASSDFSYSTCDRANGVLESEYAAGFYGGRVFPDVLNQPSQYIVDGDWVVSDSYVWADPMAQPTLHIDFAVD